MATALKLELKFKKNNSDLNQDASQTYSFFILHSHSIAENKINNNNKKIGRIKEKNRDDLEITDVTRGNTTVKITHEHRRT